MSLLIVEDLRTYFRLRSGTVRAVDGISYSVEQGETLGIVGESGSGKSVSSLSLLGLIPMPPGSIESGVAHFDGIDLLSCSSARLRGIRGKRISMIFQDPMTALNPYLTIGAQVMEPLRIHERCSRGEAHRRAVEMLEAVGIRDADRRMRAYPHQFSGGLRQRVMIAMALITRPQLLIADEPTTALDVTVQAQILDLIKRLQRELGMAVILITHDLGVVAETCDRVLVMYAGRIVESSPAEALFDKPQHPYTEALMASLPSRRAKGEALYTIPGMPPDLVQPIKGCAFAPRCEKATGICRTSSCELRSGDGARATACVRIQRGELG
ncbi:MAG: ABC transporter ATP-binding protein [Candidatus Hydrogenedentes bacterium]|nr:ABC transporter ATP-binding protein [Candidatus Hydrogenedentota bacterium]